MSGLKRLRDLVMYCIPHKSISEIASVVRKSLRLGASVQPDYCCLLGVYGIDKVEERLKFVSMPCYVKKRGELLRVYFNGDNTVASMLFEPLRIQIGPFRVSGRDAIFQQTADGFIVVLGDVGQLDCGHASETRSA
jgi:hypothetical protein